MSRISATRVSFRRWTLFAARCLPVITTAARLFRAIEPRAHLGSESNRRCAFFPHNPGSTAMGSPPGAHRVKTFPAFLRLCWRHSRGGVTDNRSLPRVRPCTARRRRYRRTLAGGFAPLASRRDPRRNSHGHRVFLRGPRYSTQPRETSHTSPGVITRSFPHVSRCRPPH